jgi:hypothetical protein
MLNEPIRIVSIEDDRSTDTVRVPIDELLVGHSVAPLLLVVKWRLRFSGIPTDLELDVVVCLRHHNRPV